jgi:hypothetical protein
MLVDSFSASDLATLIWSHATVGAVKLDDKASILDLLANVAICRLDEFQSHDWRTTLWSIKTLNPLAPLLYDAIANAALNLIHAFSAQALSTTAWLMA